MIGLLLRLAISLIGLGVVVYVLRGIDLLQTVETMAEAHPVYLTAGLFLIAVSVFLRTLRWGYMLTPQRPVSLTTLAGPLMIGFAIGNITATGIGSIPRSILVARREGMGTPFVLGTVLLEFVIDAAAVVSWAALTSFLIVLPEAVKPLRFLLVLFALCIYLVILAFRRRRSLLAPVLPLSRLAPLASYLPPEIGGGWEGFLAGASAFLNHPRVLLKVAVLTLGVWVVESLLFWVLMLSVGIGASLFQGSVVMAFTHVVIGVPSLPGFVGTLDAAALTAMSTMDLAGPKALSYTLIVHAYLIVPLTLAGAILAWREGIALAGRRLEPS